MSQPARIVPFKPSVVRVERRGRFSYAVIQEFGETWITLTADGFLFRWTAERYARKTRESE